MLAGIVFPFCLPLFTGAAPHPVLAITTVATFIIVRSASPRYALVASIVVAIFTGNTVNSLPGNYSGSIFGALRPVLPSVSLSHAFELAIP